MNKDLKGGGGWVRRALTAMGERGVGSALVDQAISAKVSTAKIMCISTVEIGNFRKRRSLSETGPPRRTEARYTMFSQASATLLQEVKV